MLVARQAPLSGARIATHENIGEFTLTQDFASLGPEPPIAEQLAEGRSTRSFARELGCHQDTILEVARRRGITLES